LQDLILFPQIHRRAAHHFIKKKHTYGTTHILTSIDRSEKFISKPGLTIYLPKNIFTRKEQKLQHLQGREPFVQMRPEEI